MRKQDVTFISLIKLVHPDIAGPYSSHERAIQVVRYKDSPEKLKKLAESWGIVTTKGSWEVKKRGLMAGDIITYLYQGSRWKDGVLTEVRVQQGRYIGSVTDSDGLRWELKESDIGRLRVKFKAVCRDMAVFTVKADMRQAGLFPNTNYMKFRVFVEFRKLKYQVYKTTHDKVYLINKHGVFSVNPKVVKPWRT